MTSKITRQVRNAITAALCITGFAGASSISLAAPSAEPALNAPQRANDVSLPAVAKRGTGSEGALNLEGDGRTGDVVCAPRWTSAERFRQRTAEDKGKGRKSWIGTFADQPGSVAVLTTYKGVTTGFATYGAETWEVMPGKAGKHVLYRVDDSKLPTAEPESAPPRRRKTWRRRRTDGGTGVTTAAAGAMCTTCSSSIRPPHASLMARPHSRA